MRGFTSRVSVGDATDWIDAVAKPERRETVHVTESHGRVLCDAIVAAMDVPSFDRSAMDGYALRAAETDGASDYNPLEFRVIGESMPGKPFSGSIEGGTCIRIMTGAPMPSGVDAVLPAEYAEEFAGVVRFSASVPPGKHIGCRGEDVQTGQRMFCAGRRLRPQDVGLLASIGVSHVPVWVQPSVRLLVTGDELVPAGESRGPHQIYDSNSGVLSGLVNRDGGRLEPIRRLVDDRAAIRAAMRDPGADVILVSGGSSVGAEDHAPTIVAEDGELAVHGIAIRPSSPTGMGRIGSSLVFLLPGNPVSCLCAYDFFAARAIRLIGGRGTALPYVVRSIVVNRKIVSAIGRVDYCRVAFETDGGLVPISTSGASILSSTTRADGFVVVPAESEGYAPGTRVDVYQYDGC
ncbi:MAG: molybdopterin molybdotransferase MoeA [Planctomycetota bacterium]|nr:molybdopterin molybdotransferase MoeA [Planctomycetota bacterium]